MKSSSGDHSGTFNKYLMTDFWTRPEFQFWERDSYTEKGKEYFRKLARRDQRLIDKKGPNFLPNH